MIIISATLLKVLTMNNKKAVAMSLWPVIIFRDRKTSENLPIKNHEKIHHRQQLEMLIIPYYIWYFVEYWVGRARLKSHDKAYRNVSFEKEAYAMQNDLDYLKNRPFLNCLKWCGKSD